MRGQQGSFSELFKKEVEKQLNSLAPNQVVKGVVTKVSKDYVSVDIGYKSEGLIPTSQFTDRQGNITVKEGDIVDVYIVYLENDYNELILSRERAVQKIKWEEIQKAYERGETVRGVVECRVKGGLQVDIGIPAFLPGSQVDVKPVRDLEELVGKEFEFAILKLTKEKGNVVLSRRALIVEEQEKLRQETLKVLAEGVVMEGTVKNLTEYGAFIDLGGVDGLLHLTDITWGRINHPAEKLSIGQRVPVVVLKYDPEQERVNLGMKQLKEDPWLTVPEKYPVGSKVKGKVIVLADYGAFVEIEEGVEGLIHISEMSWTKKVKHPSKILKVGQEVEALVLGIEEEARKLSLGLKQLQPNPWEEFARQHPVGSRVKGVVTSITDFGVFVRVGEVDGLIHVSDFSWTRRTKEPEEIAAMFKKGQEVEAVVLEIDVQGERLSLGIKQLTEDPWDKLVQIYPVGAKVSGKITSVTDFGVFIELEGGLEGLVHTSQLLLKKGEKIKKKYKIGDVIEAVVIETNKDERRLGLSQKALEEQKKPLTEGMMDDGGTVTFGDLLKDKLDFGGGSGSSGEEG
ncbi:MAG: 30S ribosomal protein S1 [Candidatus Dadabacteria bacterium]|nr:MAG: 30S ribosomal protein S1 [Candidatus Dadabacteria bacterium]